LPCQVSAFNSSSSLALLVSIVSILPCIPDTSGPKRRPPPQARLDLELMHPRSGKVNSANLCQTEFYEVASSFGWWHHACGKRQRGKEA
jgi:hypothetical protein